MAQKKLRFNSKVIHATTIDNDYGAVTPPIYQTSTFKQVAPGINKGFEYSRVGNPTRSNLENTIATIENGKFGIAFSSGVAALDALMKLFTKGDEIIVSSHIYGGTHRLFTKIYEPLGIIFHFVSMEDVTAIEPHITKNTKLIWIETPTNPTLTIIDLKAIAILAKNNNLLLGVDNTFATPYLQQPLNFGADIVMHSATKYLSGHSDVILGALIVNDPVLAEKLQYIQKSCGAIASPMDSFLVLRGIKTLSIRMQRHCENAQSIAIFLDQHSKIKKVYWPGLPSHQNHIIAKKQMYDFGGVVSFVPKSNDVQAGVNIIKELQLFTLAESLGGVESLVAHPASMSHGAMSSHEREEVGVEDNLIRLSVGIEDINDLITDLEEALFKIK